MFKGFFRTQQKNTYTSLMEAVKNDNLYEVIYYIRRGKFELLTKQEREYLLNEAIKRGRNEIIKIIKTNIGINRLLKRALDNKDLEMAKILIENGADVNILYYEAYSSALEHFANTESLIVVKFLLENGANTDKPLRCHPGLMGSEISYDIFKLLYENGAKIQLNFDYEKKDVCMIECIISKRKKPNYVKREEGIENFHNLNDYLILNAKIPGAVSFLIKHGCNVNYVCPYSGDTALLRSVEMNDSVELLLKNGANANYVHPRSGDTALILSAKSLSFDSVRTLFRYGSKVGYVNNDGHNALFYAQEANTLVREYRNDYDNAGYMEESSELKRKKREIIDLLSH